MLGGVSIILISCSLLASAERAEDPRDHHVEPTLHDPIDSLLTHLLYFPLANSKGNIVGYNTFIPNQLYAEAFPDRNNGKALNALQHKGVFPITDRSGNIFGFYTTAIGGSQDVPDVETLTANLSPLGLYPIENGKGQVVAIYRTYSSTSLGPNSFQPYQFQEPYQHYEQF